jgi:hypothetical protein
MTMKRSPESSPASKRVTAWRWLKAAVVLLFLAGVAFVTHKATLKYIELLETVDTLRLEVSRLETIVESDHEQIIVCPHVVDRNRKLSEKVK